MYVFKTLSEVKELTENWIRGVSKGHTLSR